MPEQENVQLLSAEEQRKASDLCNRVLGELNSILLGREDLHKMVLIGLLSRGHILLEGLPGLGKTALVKAVAEIFKLDFNRVQFTPDLMPADIVGAHILQETPGGTREMVFRKGPVFTNILLADEINRASPKTQSAMLEAMQEHSVTLLGTTHKLPEPLFVLASQNPIELEGTYPLPEAQLDRFLFRLLVDSVDEDVMSSIISTRRRGKPPQPKWRISKEELHELFAVMDRVHLPSPVARYVSRIVAATHASSEHAPESVHLYVTYGASPRAAIAIAEAARAHALISGRATVGFDDVAKVVSSVLNHRLILNYKAKFEKVDTMQVVNSLLESVPRTEIDLPEDVKLGV